MKLTVTIIALLIISGFIVIQYDQVDLTSTISADVEELSTEEYDGEEFLKAYEVIPFEFPKDHGPHPDYRAEWWYYTGNLADAEGNRFGYQFTVFRRGIVPGQPERESEWATRQIYFAHFTVTDVTGETFESHERYSRAAPDLAGAQADPYQVWIDDWYAKEIGPGKAQIKASQGDIGIDLILEQAKPPALQGDHGLSAKSEQPGNASYYYSLTNNPTTGTVTTPRGTFEIVNGNSWEDREWSTTDLAEGALGWDWFSLQLDDNREVMFFVIRREDGTVESVSGGTVIYPDGSTRRLALDDVQVTNLDTWTSPTSGATYPSGWEFVVSSEDLDLRITPLLKDQELHVSFIYWEGAVKIEGSHSGYGYVELTGYNESIQGRL